jgi:hypothetical protein
VASVLAEMADELFSLDRGLPYTAWCVLRSPGVTARRYVEARDPRLTRPFRLALTVLALSALVLHFSGQGAQFLAGLAHGTRASTGGTSPDALTAAMSALFARFDLALVACWVPAVALAFTRAPLRPRPNFAEATAFSLYALASLLPLQLALLLGLPLLGVQPMGFLMALPLAWLGWAVWGYLRPSGWRALALLSIPVLAVFTLCLLFVLLVFASTAIYPLLA